ncbi:MAG: hypothetical protein J5589_07980 [Firmicutes bacterium]|nr:hypothetical protein [Bacillota bacterium]
MTEKIKELLIRGIDAEKLMNELSLHFAEELEGPLEASPVLKEFMERCSDLRGFFAAQDEDLSADELDLLGDLNEDIDYELMYQFDLVEDAVKEDLIHGKLSSDIRKDMRKGGIVPLHPGEPFTEDEIEEYYVEAFRDFDAVRIRIYEGILDLSPAEFLQKGKDAREAFRKSRGLSMDEQDFNRYYLDTFDQERLQQVFARKIYDSIHFHSRYVLESFDEDDEESASSGPVWQDEEDETDLPGQAPEEDGVLVAAGDLHPEDFTFVYELLSEYNGHRILPSDDPLTEQAYWETYADEFAQVLGEYMIMHLEETIEYFDTKRPADYGTLSRLYGWSRESRKNPEIILSSCEKISFFLSDLQERLWGDFLEEELMPLYLQGQEIASGAGASPEA